MTMLRSGLLVTGLLALACSASDSDGEVDTEEQGGRAATGGASTTTGGATGGTAGPSTGGSFGTINGGRAGTSSGGSAGPGTGGTSTSSGGSAAPSTGGSAGASMGGSAGASMGGATMGGNGGRNMGGSAGNNRGGSANMGGSGGRNTGGSAGSSMGGSAGQTSGGSAGSSAGAGSTAQPLLPAIAGTCPTFMSGTATVGGLGGVVLQVGAKKEGTGSLLFYWHGTGSSAGEVNSMVPAAVRQEILAQGGIIVSFGDSLGTGGDCSGTSTFSKDDFKVADLIAACAVKDHGIDPRRIYTTGCSAGGLQAGCMGALRSSYIAAAVPNSGGEVTRQPIQDPQRIPAVMTMHGGSSDRVIVSFATTSATYDAHMKSAGGFVVNCNHGGGHCRAPAALYSAGWEFMKAHPFGVQPKPYGAGLPGSFPSYCATF